ncbi:FAR1 DNA binding domain [Macleaya cordata]|uniref:FAR1 DNA binding domain n=1 Tax=Macleaya cordata TaxID=56857 RepID=A0A200Q8T0_MACCD|nr:FAR1 DNA binding domain [Macleaya cordata]OVA09324.1 FAR1 DNA binding domain [Macleaya cordata]
MTSVGSLETENEVQCSIEKSDKPKTGMVFSSVEEAFKYYEEYGKANGFSIRKRTSYGTVRGPEITRSLFVCGCDVWFRGRSSNKKECINNEDRL